MSAVPKAQPPPPPAPMAVSPLPHPHHPLPASLHPWLLPSKDSQRHSPGRDKSDFSQPNMAVLSRPPGVGTAGATLRLRLWIHMFDLLSRRQSCVALENQPPTMLHFKAWSTCHVTDILCVTQVKIPYDLRYIYESSPFFLLPYNTSMFTLSHDWSHDAHATSIYFVCGPHCAKDINT